MLFKKMEIFLKPYYKEYYNEKEHMEFSEEEEKPKHTEETEEKPDSKEED